MKRAATHSVASDLLCAAAFKHGQMEGVAERLLGVARKCDHAPKAVAEV